jgi:prepilin-type N-terminal cleavage/methylation domain-containing protein
MSTASKVQHPERGYTLAEMAIVLVIVTLMFAFLPRFEAFASGMKAKSLAQEMQDIATAVALYRQRYAALPGDDSGAAARWAGATSGDGNGLLYRGAVQGPEDVFDTEPQSLTGAPPESLLFWQHLRLASLMPAGTGPSPLLSMTRPVSSTGHRIGVQANAMGIAAALCVDQLHPQSALELDRRLDDQRSEAGLLRAAPGSIAGVIPAAGSYGADASAPMVACMSL